MTISKRDRAAILAAIRAWPQEEQGALVQEIVAGWTNAQSPPTFQLSIYDVAGTGLAGTSVQLDGAPSSNARVTRGGGNYGA